MPYIRNWKRNIDLIIHLQLFEMELEHLTVLLSFLIFPCVIFGLGLALLFLRRSFLLITHVVMIISLPCNISFIPGQTQQARRTRSNRSWRRRTWEPPTSCWSPSLPFSSPFSFSILLFFSWCNLDVRAHNVTELDYTENSDLETVELFILLSWRVKNTTNLCFNGDVTLRL